MKTWELLGQNLRIIICEIRNKVDSNIVTVHDILHNKLNIRPVCARWIPKMLKIFRNDVISLKLISTNKPLYNTYPAPFFFFFLGISSSKSSFIDFLFFLSLSFKPVKLIMRIIIYCKLNDIQVTVESQLKTALV